MAISKTAVTVRIATGSKTAARMKPPASLGLKNGARPGGMRKPAGYSKILSGLPLRNIAALASFGAKNTQV